MTMPTGLIVPAGAGEALPGVEVRNTIKVPHSGTDGAFAAFEETTQPGFGPPVHIHTKQWEYFRVLEGEFEFLVGETRHRGGPGTVAVIPPGARHTFSNVAETDSTLEFIVAPADHIDEFFRRLTALLASGESDPDVIAALGREYDTIFVGPPLGEGA